MEVQLAHSARQFAYFHGLTMLPLLREGDHVETASVLAEDVRVGDVITYRFEDKFPTRRVIAIDRERRTLLIMGDSIRSRREFAVPFDDVLARVVRRRRDGVWMGRESLVWRLQTRRILVREYTRRARWLALPRGAWRAIRSLA